MAHVPKHRPGSFTKNFAWGGKGFKNLHDAIRSGYSSTLTTVPRDVWRKSSGINDSSLDLIPVNFFLHNLKGRMSVDELVFQALRRPHSSDFDRLALFTFHLNRVGTPPLKGPSRPALWASEFVKRVLWRNGAWQTAALSQARLDGFIAASMIGQSDVRTKSRNNYRHFFELAGYLPTATATINTGAPSWMASALFLAWDRHILDGGKTGETELLAYVRTEELSEGKDFRRLRVMLKAGEVFEIAILAHDALHWSANTANRRGAQLEHFPTGMNRVGIPKTARVRFKLHAGEGGQHVWPGRFRLIFVKG
ncbi:hypothetical protein [Bradyrhizobium sp. 2S1]|uniref:hypothetical protein n=1 Tax=Bradyrhizobium sp. 2S1 TaxID=1404429 RepID=UPI00140E8E49|nr:hypothetical protein [Bradyrhizobium sp. 2S1]MCK7666746.1 hypothetical protein [Bradyrhizobium sp. 2S1]